MPEHEGHDGGSVVIKEVPVIKVGWLLTLRMTCMSAQLLLVQPAMTALSYER